MEPSEAVKWLESGDISVAVNSIGDGRLVGRGGFVVFGHIKSDACICRGEHHYEMRDPFTSNHLSPYGYLPHLDSYEVAMKRSSPA